jgi:hypothetical protein
VYSGAYEGIAADHRVFFTADVSDGLKQDDVERNLLSAMLYCEECADALFTKEVWKNSIPLRVDISQAEADCVEGRAGLFEVIDFSIALRAKSSGRTPSQARSDARALGQLWWTSPDEAERRLVTGAKRLPSKLDSIFGVVSKLLLSAFLILASIGFGVLTVVILSNSTIKPGEHWVFVDSGRDANQAVDSENRFFFGLISAVGSVGAMLAAIGIWKENKKKSRSEYMPRRRGF